LTGYANNLTENAKITKQTFLEKRFNKKTRDKPPKTFLEKRFNKKTRDKPLKTFLEKRFNKTHGIKPCCNEIETEY